MIAERSNKSNSSSSTTTKWNTHLMFTIFLCFVVKLSKLWSENFHCHCCCSLPAFCSRRSFRLCECAPSHRKQESLTSFYFLILLLFELIGVSTCCFWNLHKSFKCCVSVEWVELFRRFPIKKESSPLDCLPPPGAESSSVLEDPKTIYYSFGNEIERRATGENI